MATKMVKKKKKNSFMITLISSVVKVHDIIF